MPKAKKTSKKRGRPANKAPPSNQRKDDSDDSSGDDAPPSRPQQSKKKKRDREDDAILSATPGQDPFHLQTRFVDLSVAKATANREDELLTLNVAPLKAFASRLGLVLAPKTNKGGLVDAILTHETINLHRINKKLQTQGANPKAKPDVVDENVMALSKDLVVLKKLGPHSQEDPVGEREGYPALNKKAAIAKRKAELASVVPSVLATYGASLNLGQEICKGKLSKLTSAIVELELKNHDDSESDEEEDTKHTKGKDRRPVAFEKCTSCNLNLSSMGCEGDCTECPDCQKKMSRGAKRCIHCGVTVRQSKEGESQQRQLLQGSGNTSNTHSTSPTTTTTSDRDRVVRRYLPAALKKAEQGSFCPTRTCLSRMASDIHDDYNNSALHIDGNGQRLSFSQVKAKELTVDNAAAAVRDTHTLYAIVRPKLSLKITLQLNRLQTMLEKYTPLSVVKYIDEMRLANEEEGEGILMGVRDQDLAESLLVERSPAQQRRTDDFRSPNNSARSNDHDNGIRGKHNSNGANGTGGNGGNGNGYVRNGNGGNNSPNWRDAARAKQLCMAFQEDKCDHELDASGQHTIKHKKGNGETTVSHKCSKCGGPHGSQTDACPKR